MKRPIHLAMERHEFKCRVCNIRWLMFVRTNSLCTNPSVGNGVHNFDFRKPIKIDPQENPASPIPFLSLYLVPFPYYIVIVEHRSTKQPGLFNPYYMFKYSVRTELTRKHYERRLRIFFDFIEFNPETDIEKRCNDCTENQRMRQNGYRIVS